MKRPHYLKETQMQIVPVQSGTFFFLILFSTEHLNPIVDVEKYSSCGEHNTISHHCAFDLK